MNLILSRSRLKIISGIISDIAQVFFASAFIGPILSGEGGIFLIIVGFILSVILWFGSVLLIRE